MAAVAVALVERVHALRNETRFLRQGAVEVAPWAFRLMVPVYAAIFVAAVAEHLMVGRRPSPGWVVTMLGLFVASKGLKLWVVLHLGRNWTMKVVLPERLEVITTGPYRHIRHPNYVAVIGEIVSLPLAGGAWVTALAGGILFTTILVYRVRTEEAALLAHPEYAAAMDGKGRFFPGSR